jgi:hypothetical protein
MLGLDFINGLIRPVYKKFADTPELKGLVQRIQASQGQ